MHKTTVQVGHPIIRKRSKKIAHIQDSATQQLIEDLIDSMREHRLVGMAAPQIGVNLRVFVSEIRVTDTRSGKVPDPVRVFINPKILSYSKKQVEMYEGCGSVAESGLFAPVKRPEYVVVEAYNQDGERFILDTGGLLARIIQHELDHLDGIVFLDRLTSMKKVMSRTEYMRMVGKKE